MQANMKTIVISVVVTMIAVHAAVIGYVVYLNHKEPMKTVDTSAYVNKCKGADGETVFGRDNFLMCVKKDVVIKVEMK